jgi:RecA-family ATPase
MSNSITCSPWRAALWGESDFPLEGSPVLEVHAGATSSSIGHAATFRRFAITLAQHPDTVLIIIDTFGKKAPPVGKGKSSHSYQDDVLIISELKKVADEHSVAIFLVHHTRKAAADDVMDEISDTTGISGTADTIWVMKRSRRCWQHRSRLTNERSGASFEMSVTVQGN